MKLLIIDDEPTLAETVDLRMRKEGYTTFVADTAEEGMRIFRRVKPDLILLDIMLPQRSGFDFCRAVRKEHATPIIFMSARGEERDRVAGLELGGDDYMVKPFNLSELAARVKAVLRRTTQEQPIDAVERGDLIIDPKSHEVKLRGKLVQLSAKEFALLHFLARHEGQVFTRDVLLDRVWGPETFVSGRTVDVHVRWLRTHIEENPNEPTRIMTVRGVGYKFVG